MHDKWKCPDAKPDDEEYSLAGGMHDCPCCGDAVFADHLLCDDCQKAGCEPSHDEDGAYYADCQIPACPECETRASLMNDGMWHPNCEPEECPRAAKEGNVPWA